MTGQTMGWFHSLVLRRSELPAGVLELPAPIFVPFCNFGYRFCFHNLPISFLPVIGALIPALFPSVCCRWHQTTSKITIPGRKWVYRLLSAEGVPILDIMLKDGETPPQPGVPVLAR